MSKNKILQHKPPSDTIKHRKDRNKVFFFFVNRWTIHAYTVQLQNNFPNNSCDTDMEKDRRITTGEFAVHMKGTKSNCPNLTP